MAEHDSVVAFHRSLREKVGRPLVLKINRNRSTVLSVRWEEQSTHVSMHEIFLRAPENIMDALACYLKREKKSIAPIVQDFIDREAARSHCPVVPPHPNQLSVEGEVYNLKELFDRLNEHYFESVLEASLTWYGHKRRGSGRNMTLGSYHALLGLIKVHRILDTPSVPPEVVSYVLYHEMLHIACPPENIPGSGRRIHSKVFREREKTFAHYIQAMKWIKTHQHLLFQGAATDGRA